MEIGRSRGGIRLPEIVRMSTGALWLLMKGCMRRGFVVRREAMLRVMV